MLFVSGSTGVAGRTGDAAHWLSPGASSQLQPLGCAERLFAVDDADWTVYGGSAAVMRDANSTAT